MWATIQAVIAGEMIFEAASILLNVVVLAAWYVVGRAVLMKRDREDNGKLFKFARSGPFGAYLGPILVIMAWPVTLLLYCGGVFDEP